ncbi:MAG: ribosome biogenesis GTP-binding protein YihA/YsxC, partial [Parvularculaceae bacterium]|nr:ribosome biogenesis GTP-binding protein YihA/YsxC [Parvularculaceae bacterium]
MGAHPPEAIEAARRLFAGPCAFMTGATSMEGLPDAGPPEFAFAGRSNVGKSSLLNALTGRKGLARASNTPGRTRELNFFDLGGVLRLVDLPGYGFAAASDKDVKTWTHLTRDFLRGRQTLRRVFLLIDSRHGVKPSDLDVMAALDAAAVGYAVVLTKIDKLKPPERDKAAAATAQAIARRPAAHPTIRSVSATEGWGVPELRADIAGMAAW